MFVFCVPSKALIWIHKAMPDATVQSYQKPHLDQNGNPLNLFQVMLVTFFMMVRSHRRRSDSSWWVTPSEKEEREDCFRRAKKGGRRTTSRNFQGMTCFSISIWPSGLSFGWIECLHSHIFLLLGFARRKCCLSIYATIGWKEEPLLFLANQRKVSQLQLDFLFVQWRFVFTDISFCISFSFCVQLGMRNFCSFNILFSFSPRLADQPWSEEHVGHKYKLLQPQSSWCRLSKRHKLPYKRWWQNTRQPEDTRQNKPCE